MLSVNKLSNIIIPDDSPEQIATDTVSLDTIQQYTPKEQESLSRQSSISNISSIGNTSASNEATSLLELNSKDISLKFFITKARGWPQNSSTLELIKSARSNKIKWTYTNKNFEEEEILRKTEKGEIKLHKCFFSVEEDLYRKIRSGLSPMEKRDPRLNKKHLHH